MLEADIPLSAHGFLREVREEQLHWPGGATAAERGAALLQV